MQTINFFFFWTSCVLFIRWGNTSPSALKLRTDEFFSLFNRVLSSCIKIHLLFGLDVYLPGNRPIPVICLSLFNAQCSVFSGAQSVWRSDYFNYKTWGKSRREYNAMNNWRSIWLTMVPAWIWFFWQEKKEKKHPKSKLRKMNLFPWSRSRCVRWLFSALRPHLIETFIEIDWKMNEHSVTYRQTHLFEWIPIQPLFSNSILSNPMSQPDFRPNEFKVCDEFLKIHMVCFTTFTTHMRYENVCSTVQCRENVTIVYKFNLSSWQSADDPSDSFWLKRTSKNRRRKKMKKKMLHNPWIWRDVIVRWNHEYKK